MLHSWARRWQIFVRQQQGEGQTRAGFQFLSQKMSLYTCFYKGKTTALIKKIRQILNRAPSFILWFKLGITDRRVKKMFANISYSAVNAFAYCTFYD